MKSQVANYETKVLCLRIEPLTGSIIRITNYPRDLTMLTGEVYLTGTGYDFTDYAATSSLTPSAIELGGIAGIAGVGKDEIASGVFDNARCYLFATNWDSPEEDYEPLVASVLGKTVLMDEVYTIEEMSLIATLNQSVGRTYTAQCYKTLGGQEFAGCKYNLVPVTGSITTVTSRTIFRDSTRVEAADFFGAGTIQFTSGLNAGLKPLEIKSYLANGTIEVFEPFYYAISPGDTYSMKEGCRKTRDACVLKNNIINFGGFPNIPTGSQYAEIGLN